MPGTILVIGSSNVDLIMKMDRLPGVGETIPNATFMQTFGGKGANQAMAAALTGAQVEFMSCVGDDTYGALVIQNMQRAGVGVDWMRIEPGMATGTAFIMVGGQGENYLAVAPGANYRLNVDDIHRVSAAMGQASLVMLQYEILPETLQSAIDLANSLDKPVMFNLAPAHPLNPALLAKITYLVVNESEAEFLCGLKVNTESSAREAAGALLAKGAKVVILTLGAKGALVATPAGIEIVPAFHVKAVDTTAAGDTFCGALACALVEGKTLAEGVRFASAAAAISVTRMGAQPSIPTRMEVEEFIKLNS